MGGLGVILGAVIRSVIEDGEPALPQGPEGGSCVTSGLSVLCPAELNVPTVEEDETVTLSCHSGAREIVGLDFGPPTMMMPSFSARVAYSFQLLTPAVS